MYQTQFRSNIHFKIKIYLHYKANVSQLNSFICTEVAKIYKISAYASSLKSFNY